MSDGLAELDAMIERVRRLPELGKRAAPEVARVVESELHRTIAAGTTPYGEAWPLTQTGTRPLTHAANAVAVVAVGSTVFVRLTGPEARHHLGRGRGGVRREVIPTRGIPDRMAEQIRTVLGDAFRELARGKP